MTAPVRRPRKKFASNGSALLTHGDDGITGTPPPMRLRLLVVLLVCCTHGDAIDGSQQNESRDVSTQQTMRTAISAGVGVGVGVAGAIATGTTIISTGAAISALVAGVTGVAAYYLTGMVYDAASYMFQMLQSLFQETRKWLDKVCSRRWHDARCRIMGDFAMDQDLNEYFEARSCLRNAIGSYKRHERTCLDVSSMDARSECVREGQQLHAEVRGAKVILHARSKTLQSCYNYSNEDLEQLFRNYWDKMREQDEENLDSSTVTQALDEATHLLQGLRNMQEALDKAPIRLNIAHQDLRNKQETLDNATHLLHTNRQDLRSMQEALDKIPYRLNITHQDLQRKQEALDNAAHLLNIDQNNLRSKQEALDKATHLFNTTQQDLRSIIREAGDNSTHLLNKPKQDLRSTQKALQDMQEALDDAENLLNISQQDLRTIHEATYLLHTTQQDLRNMKEALDKATIMLTLILTVGFVLLCVLGVGTFPAAHTYFVVSQMNHPLLTHDPTKPLKLSKLKLREVLGRGTFGIVHRASYYGLCVAVKQLTPINDEDGMVEREIDLHRRLQCPTLLRMYGVCKDRFNVYLVLEYALYGSLRKVCRGTGINAHNCINAEGVDVSLEQRMQWLTDIMAAVSYLHKHNVLHRDIKCDNVVLRADMRALLGDLGLSINLTSRRSHASSQGVGTCVFRAPEVSEPGGYKASADVYSFGITVMELLLSSIPGSREHGLDDMQSLSETCPELEFQLQKLRFIAERCTSHTPGDRPCATQVLQWLDNVTYLCWSNPRIDDHDW